MAPPTSILVDPDEDAALVFVDPAKVGDYPPNPDPTPAPEAISPYGGGGQAGVGPHFPPDLASVPTSEPKWAKRVTYMTVRVSAFPAPVWDAVAQPDQQQAVGRFKRTGASLDLPEASAPSDPPAFAADQTNTAVSLRAHIRNANPRGADDAKRRIFRQEA